MYVTSKDNFANLILEDIIFHISTFPVKMSVCLYFSGPVTKRGEALGGHMTSRSYYFIV